MLKSKKRIYSLIIMLLIFSAFILSKNVYQKGFKETFSGITNVISFLSPNEITSLDKPDGLAWKESSTATAKWNVVENANYYIVNVYLYDDSKQLIGQQETGTASGQAKSTIDPRKYQVPIFRITICPTTPTFRTG